MALQEVETLTDSPKVVEYDEIIAHRDNRWRSASIGMGEVMEFKGRPVAIPKTEWLEIYRGQRNSEWRLASGLHRLENPYDRAI